MSLRVVKVQLTLVIANLLVAITGRLLYWFTLGIQILIKVLDLLRVVAILPIDIQFCFIRNAVVINFGFSSWFIDCVIYFYSTGFEVWG